MSVLGTAPKIWSSSCILLVMIGATAGALHSSSVRQARTRPHQTSPTLNWLVEIMHRVHVLLKAVFTLCYVYRTYAVHLYDVGYMYTCYSVNTVRLTVLLWWLCIEPTIGYLFNWLTLQDRSTRYISVNTWQRIWDAWPEVYRAFTRRQRRDCCSDRNTSLVEVIPKTQSEEFWRTLPKCWYYQNVLCTVEDR